MEVLRHGNTYNEVECEKCYAILSYCETDIKHDDREDDYFGELHYSYRKYVICPECKSETNISWIINGKEFMK